MFIDLKGFLFRSTIFQKKISGGRNNIFFFKTIAGKKNDLYTHHFFCTSVDGINRHPIIKSELFIRLQFKMKIDRVSYGRRYAPVQHSVFYFYLFLKIFGKASLSLSVPNRSLQLRKK